MIERLDGGTLRAAGRTARHVGGRTARSVGRVAVRAARRLAEPRMRLRAVRIGRTLRRSTALLIVTLAGVALGVLLGGRVAQNVGPFQAEFAVTPSLSGGTRVDIPPLGSVLLRSHDGPAKLSLKLGSLDQKRAVQLVQDPNALDTASNNAIDDLGTGVSRLALRTAGVSVLGAVLLSALVFRNMRRVAICGGLALATVAATGAVTVATFRAGAVEEPRYEGLLANAPAVVGDARRIADQYGEYKAELQRMVRNVDKLYGALSTLPLYQPEEGTIRVLHVSDLHLNPAAWSVIQTVVSQFGIDMVIDTGDLNDWGTRVESSYVDTIRALNVPYVYIRGNHDSTLTAQAVAAQPNAIVLDDRITTVRGLTIAGIGDPRFTPDKSTETGSPESGRQALSAVSRSSEELARTIRASADPVDIALVHDPASAGALAGACPLVLAGHLHHRENRTLAAEPTEPKTTLLVEGSTGGAGLRGLEGEQPTPLEMSVLYFGTDRGLRAYDDITVGGTGQAQVTLQRHLVSTTPVPSR